MALMDAILAPGKERGTKIAALGIGASSTEQSLGKHAIFSINSDVDITIRFGIAGMSAADTTDFRIPANTSPVWYLGDAFTHIRVFNQDAGTANVYFLTLSRF